MAELVKCFECGQFVSSEAKICPNCKKNPHQFIFHCVLCGRLVNKNDVIHKMHSACWERHKDNIDMIQFSCPLCRKVYYYEDIKSKVQSGKFECTGCGHPILIVTCNSYWCQQPLALHSAFELEAVEDVADRHSTCHYHYSCAQILMKIRRSEKCCIICGRALRYNQSIFGKIFFKKTCWYH